MEQKRRTINTAGTKKKKGKKTLMVIGIILGLAVIFYGSYKIAYGIFSSDNESSSLPVSTGEDISKLSRKELEAKYTELKKASDEKDAEIKRLEKRLGINTNDDDSDTSDSESTKSSESSSEDEKDESTSSSTSSEQKKEETKPEQAAKPSENKHEETSSTPSSSSENKQSNSSSSESSSESTAPEPAPAEPLPNNGLASPADLEKASEAANQ